MSVLTTLVQNIAGDLSQCDKARIGNRRHIGKKGRNGIIAICIWHDCLSRNSQGIYLRK